MIESGIKWDIFVIGTIQFIISRTPSIASVLSNVLIINFFHLSVLIRSFGVEQHEPEISGYLDFLQGITNMCDLLSHVITKGADNYSFDNGRWSVLNV